MFMWFNSSPFAHGLFLTVFNLGKPGLERFIQHPQQAAVLQMIFVTNQVSQILHVKRENICVLVCSRISVSTCDSVKLSSSPGSI